MSYVLKLSLLVCLISLPPVVIADAKLTFAAPQNVVEKQLKAELEEAGELAEVIAFINELFVLPAQLYFVFGGNDGPLFDANENQILVPYSFIQEVQDRFKNAKYANTGVSVKEATGHALMHTLFHEFAHAAIYNFDLPVLGKEEDAADGLASVFLIEYFDNGQELMISAADLFDLESEDRQTVDDEDLADEHSLDAQRFFSTMCHAYGSNPQKYAFILDQETFSSERGELCIEEYETLLRSANSVLEPHMKDEK